MATKKKDKQAEKEELLEKVFGKDAPNRKLTEEDLKMLKYNPFDGTVLSDEWKSIEENSRKLKEQTEKMLEKNDKFHSYVRKFIWRLFGKR
jgi:hypothetical protein